MARDHGKGAESAEEKRKREQGAEVTRAVEAAIESGDLEGAGRLAAGHPDAAEQLKLMQRISNAARAGAGAPEGGGEALATFGEGADLAGDVPAQPVHLRAFRVVKATAKLKHLNLRAERHGSEEVPALDAKFEANLPATILDLFDPALRAFLFHKSTDPQDLADQAHPAPNLRVPEIKPLEWKRNIEGATVTIAYGISDAGAIVLGLARVTGFKLEPKEGGTVVVTFVVKVQNVDGEEVGRLAMLVKRETTITVEPPETGWHVETEGEGGEDD